jgi:16S rRNA (cytidine1402-2'-O)-methyltransferase
MSTLYIVATPIGNLEDITMRALRILGEVDFILCEDTRVTKRLLDHYKIATPTISYHQHSGLLKVEKILDLLEQDKSLALVSDAGTPGISDPGGKLVAAVIERFGSLSDENEITESMAQVQIESVPGPSAVTAALSISGIPTDKFVFLGFPPNKKGRQAFMKKILDCEWPVVVYESKHRIIKFLEELEQLSLNAEHITHNEDGEDEEAEITQEWKKKSDKKAKKLKTIESIVVCRELSKMFETVYRGNLKYIINQIKDDPNAQKGEFVVIVGK